MPPQSSRSGRSGGSNRRPPKPKSEFAEHVIQVDRVTRTVKGGRRMRFRATVVIGDKLGRVGLGIGKGEEVQAAIQKAVSKARRGMITVPMKDETIPHPLTIKFKSARIILMPAEKGTGIIAGGAVRNVLEVAGVKNVRSKSHGSSNKLTTAQAIMSALGKLKKA